jgi:hypothetical protein
MNKDEQAADWAKARRIGEAAANGDRDAEILMVKLVVDEVRERIRGPGAWQDLPGHLPDDEMSQRKLWQSSAAADLTMKRDLLAWVEANRTAEVDCLASSRVIVFAVHMIDRLIAKADQEEGEKLWGWREQLVDCLVARFRVDPAAAPTKEQEVDEWLAHEFAEQDPVPEWMRKGGPPVFKASNREDARARSIARAMEDA